MDNSFGILSLPNGSANVIVLLLTGLTEQMLVFFLEIGRVT